MNILPAEQYKPEAFGFYAGIPMETYQKLPGLSKSQADTLRRSPLDLLRVINGQQLERDPSDAMELGTVYHSIVWEDKYEFYIRPATYQNDKGEKKPWNGNANACKEWLAEHSDHPVYTQAEIAAINTGAQYVRTHPHAAPIINAPGMVEVSMFHRAEKYGFPIRGRADKVYFDQGRIYFADLKTTRDASTRAISREILNRRYHVQAAMYRYIARRCGFDFGGFTFIFFEAGTAPKCNVRTIAARAIDEGEKQLQADFDLYQQCRVSRVWPEWSDHCETPGTIDLPEFVYGDVDVLTGMTAASVEEAA